MKKWKTRLRLRGKEREREVFKTIKRRKSFGDSVAEHCFQREVDGSPPFPPRPFALRVLDEIVRVLKTFNVIYLRTSP